MFITLYPYALKISPYGFCVCPYARKHVSLRFEPYIHVLKSIYPYGSKHISLCLEALILMHMCMCPYAYVYVSLCICACVLIPE